LGQSGYAHRRDKRNNRNSWSLQISFLWHHWSFRMPRPTTVQRRNLRLDPTFDNSNVKIGRDICCQIIFSCLVCNIFLWNCVLNIKFGRCSCIRSIVIFLCYWNSHRHSSNLCAQCTSWTWISVARTFGLGNWQQKFPYINVDFGICVIFKFIYLKCTQRSSELQTN